MFHIAAGEPTITSIYSNIGSSEPVNGTTISAKYSFICFFFALKYLQYKNIKNTRFIACRVLLETHEGKCNTICELQILTCLPAISIPERCYQFEFETDLCCKTEKIFIKLNGAPLSLLYEVKETNFPLRKAY